MERHENAETQRTYPQSGASQAFLPVLTLEKHHGRLWGKYQDRVHRDLGTQDTGPVLTCSWPELCLSMESELSPCLHQRMEMTSLEFLSVFQSS